jgi:outer membrane receptor protein involved in Fe transport
MKAQDTANSLLGAVALIIAVSGFVAETANSQESQVLEEVIVTAQKREQSLQDVGISIAAVTGGTMRDLGLTNTIDALVKIPNVAIYSAYGPGTTANVVVRGVGLNDFGEGHEAPVTTYVDEFYLVSVPTVGFSMFDIERMEVLRGPQGTLFGRNATGGLVHFLTAKPTAEPEAFLEVTGGRFEEFKLEGALSGPLSENMSARLSVLSHHSDGYLENANPAFDPAGEAGMDAVRGQILWDLDSGWSVLLKAEYGELDSRHLYYQQEPAVKDLSNGGLFVRDPGGTDGAGYNQAEFQNGRAASSMVADTNYPQHMESDSATFLLRIDKTFNDVTFTSLTGYLDHSRELFEDCDASPNSICFAEFPYETDTFTQELRWVKGEGTTRWTAGVYYLVSDATNNPSATFNVPISGPGAVDPVTELYNGDLFPISLAANWVLDTTSYSAFGQLEHDISETVTLIGGLRVTRDEKDFLDYDNASLRVCNSFPIPSNCFTDYTPTPYEDDYGQTLYSGKLEVDWRPSDDTLIYGSFSRGTKAGGFNNGFYAGGISFDQIPYDDEVLYAYEAGAKNTLLDGRARLNFSAFYYDYKDFQTFNWIGIGGTIVNSDAESMGLEVEAEGRLGENWMATLGLALLDTEIKDVQLPDGITTRDVDMAMAPDWGASGSLQYNVAMGDNGLFSLLWDFNYVGDHNSNNFNDPAADIDAYFLHNFRISYAFNDQWELAGLVRNVSDNRTVIRTFVFADLGYAQDMYTHPRTYAAQLTYRW